MKTSMNRRSFLGATAAGVAAFNFIPNAISAPPSGKLNLGFVGPMGRGRANLNGLKREVNVMALCDVDGRNMAKVKQEFTKVDEYVDYRKMLERKDLDAVVVSTPDHTHAVAAAAALRSGRHVYCEKPLTHTVSEARILTDLAAKTGLKTQMGNQIHSHPLSNYRRVVELVQSGAIGKVNEVHVWCGATYGPMELDPNPGPAPKEVNYDLWLGPVKYTPYRPEYVPFKWRNFWHFGGGTQADFWCHFSDLPHWSLKLSYPSTIEATGTDPHPIFATRDMKVDYLYPARGDMPEVKLTWYQGKYRPTHLVSADLLKKYGSGVLFVGEKGQLIANYTKRQLLPEENFKDFKAPDPWIEDSIGHHKEWIHAIKNGGISGTDFSYAGPLTEAALLGIAAHRSGRKIHWDPVNLKAIGAPAVDEFLQHDYRAGWKL
ncbi:MAG: Gfo/Idh/MocA family protein [Limisphaerales bacterium]